MSRRVVITGAGIVSAIGIGVDEFWRRCLEAKSVVAPIPAHWGRFANLRSRLWSPLLDIDPASFELTRTEQLQLDPVTVLALGAAREAVDRAGLALTRVGAPSRNFLLSGIDADRTGVYVGTGLGGGISFLRNHTHHLLRKPRIALATYIEENAAKCDCEILTNILPLMTHGPRFNPFEVSMVMPNAPGAAIGIKFSLTGPNITYCAACASGTISIGNAFHAVRDGRADIVITGGCEYFADDHGHIFRSFDAPGALVQNCVDPDLANRPFDVNRSGFLFSQGGAAMLILEELDHALRRGTTIVAEVIGYGESFDAHSMMSLAPGGEQIERMIRAAVADAHISPNDVDYINAHGTGTRNNDQTEADVIDRVFGRSVRINSTKSLLGHAIGASGAIEALVTALTLRDGTTHICKNLDTPVRDLNFVRQIEHFEPRVGLSQSFAFGGHNAAVVMRRYK